jgi:transcriptional regulator with XRE-family HTH domain
MARLEALLTLAAEPAFNVTEGLGRFARWLEEDPADRGRRPAAMLTPVPCPGVFELSELRGGPLVMRVTLGRYLRKLRESSGTSASQAAGVIRGSASLIELIEQGRRKAVHLRDVTDLLTLYGVASQQIWDQVLYLASQCAARPWWHGFCDVIPEWLHPYMELEEAAASIDVYSARQIPDLLQTPDYARALMNAADPAMPADEAELRLKLLEARQAALTGPHPLHYRAVIDEDSLWGMPGGPDVARGQLRYLICACNQPNVSIQIVNALPFSCASGLFRHACCCRPGRLFASAPASVSRAPPWRMRPRFSAAAGSYCQWRVNPSCDGMVSVRRPRVIVAPRTAPFLFDENFAANALCLARGTDSARTARKRLHLP